MNKVIPAIWARVSTWAQEESLPGQVNDIRARIEKEAPGCQIKPEHIFAVVWTSTDLEPCAKYQQLKRLIEAREITHLGLYDRDRLHEGIRRVFFFEMVLKENNVTPLVCQGPPFIDSDDNMIFEFFDAAAKKRSNKRAQDGALAGLSKRARERNRPPTKAQIYGWKWERGADGHYVSDGGYKPDEYHDNTQLILRLWFETRNLDTIAWSLYERGIPSPRGGRTWSRETLRNFIRNPILAGRVATLKYERVAPKNRRTESFGKSTSRMKPESQWHYIDGLVEQPILTWDEHLSILEQLKMNRLKASRNAKRDYLLRGLVKCQLCGRSFFGVTKHNYSGYVCGGAWGVNRYQGKCEAVGLNQQALEADVKRRIRAYLEDPAVYETEAENRLTTPEHTRRQLESRLINLDKQRQQTLTDEIRYANQLSDEAFQSEQSLLIAKRKWCTEETERVKVQLANIDQLEANRRTVKDMAEIMRGNLDNATKEQWRRILEDLGTRVLAFGDGTWEVEVNVPIATRTPWYTCPC